MVKRALVVGCNYPGTVNQLNGCVNDVDAVTAMLLDDLGFDKQHIVTMIDTDPKSEQPTGVNIKNQLTKLVAASRRGDVLFFHYSGHGTQVPSEDNEATEEDDQDEAIVPTDINLITDDDLRKIVAKLKPDVKFTMVADCCHSGTLLDQPTVEISGPKDDDPPPPPLLARAAAACALPSEPSEKARCCSYRKLSAEAVAQALATKLGVKKVKPREIRAALVAAFGSDASSKLASLIAHVEKEAAAKLEEMAKVKDAALENDQQQPQSLAEAPAAVAPGQCSNSRELGGKTLFHLAVDLQRKPEVKSHPRGVMRSGGGSAAQVPDGQVILVTGCQDTEESADACPSGDPEQAFGAMTNALTTVIKEFSAAYPDKQIAVRTLVLHVRDMLEKGNYGQNPCLECSDAAADAAFVVT